jgi:hypothetical protein
MSANPWYHHLSPNLLASSMLLSFVDLFGLAPLCGTEEERWDPRTVEMELESVCGMVAPQNIDKLMAAAEVLSTNDFERSLPDFIRICNVLADSPTDGTFDPAEAHEIAWALIETQIWRDETIPFTPEIVGYIQKMLLDAGFTSVPEPFGRALTNTDFAWQQTEQDFDDADLYELSQSVESERQQELQLYLSRRLSRLFQELNALPLSARDPQWQEKIIAQLRAFLQNETQTSGSDLA